MAKTLQPTGIRTFELIVPITGPLEGEFSDWPSKIQDGIEAALERKAQEVELPLKMVHARCDIDHDAEVEGRPHQKFYIHVVASEVVMADERTIDRRRLH